MGYRGYKAARWAFRASRSRRAANCVRNSFTLDTGILMSDGSYKPIGQVEIGDEVIAADPKTGERRSETVLDVITGNGDKHLVGVRVDMNGDGLSDEVVATDRHPFYVLGKGWTDAIALRQGDLLATSTGTGVVTSTRAWHEDTTVRNLTVSRLHTYHVGVDAGAALVHNCINGWTKHGREQAQRRVFRKTWRDRRSGTEKRARAEEARRVTREETSGWC
jgi:hypothetical protein